MPTVMNSHHLHSHATHRTLPQRVCIGLGLVFLAMGLAGVVVPELLGLHLSVAHNSIHLVSGALALMMGFSSHTKSYNFCLVFGFVYGLLGIVGFLMGTPGYPAMGHREADQHLFKIIPQVLEFGTADHLIHLLLSSIFLFTAYVARKEKGLKSKISSRTPINFRSDISRENTVESADLRSRAQTERRI